MLLNVVSLFRRACVFKWGVTPLRQVATAYWTALCGGIAKPFLDAQAWLWRDRDDQGYVEFWMRALERCAPYLRFLFRCWRGRRVLYVGHCYYNPWYLSRALRRHGWRADVLNWNGDPNDQIYFHGEDFKFTYGSQDDLRSHFRFYFQSIFRYDVFHFSNAHAMHYGPTLHGHVKKFAEPYWEVRLLRMLGKKIVYSNNGCLDGVSQTSFRSWNPEKPVCDICHWRNVPWVCSDEINLAWGKTRNELADFQCTLGGNRKDYNDDPRVHEVPEFYCLDPDVWRPDLPVPESFQLKYPKGTIRLYHAVGNYELRTRESKANIKSTHIYLPLIERLKGEGYPVELMFFTKVPNKDVRFYQVQADIFLDMLTFGFFGATAREAMMLGKPVICYLRQEWLDSMRKEIPEYVDELPILTATPETVYNILKDLIENPEKRKLIGERSRAFALKWHSSEAGARRLDRIYRDLLR